jgi:hypothetical protein
MSDDNIVDFKTRAKKIIQQKERAAEEDPLRAFFRDDDITDMFMSALMFLRLTSTTHTVNIKIDDDRLEIESKNMTEFDVGDIDKEELYTRVASMDLTDDDDEELPAEVLVKLFQQCVEAIIIPDDDDEPDKTN